MDRQECLSCLDVQVTDVEGVVFDEFAARFYGVAHQHGEYLAGLYCVFNSNLQQSSLLWVHGCFPELLGIHLAQPFVALDREIFFRRCQHFFEQGLARRNLFAGSVSPGDKRWSEFVFKPLIKLNRLLKLYEAGEVPVDCGMQP